MVLYRFGSTGVVQCLSRAAELLGLVPVFPVRNVHTFSSGSGSAVFRDCVLVKKNSTVGDAARKIMGDIPISYIEGVGGTRVSEDDIVAVGKHDVCVPCVPFISSTNNISRYSPSKLADNLTNLYMYR